MTEWQPIETAPKDGFYNIMVSEGLGVYMATWSRLGPLPNTKFGWVTNTGFQVDPTHWMPLPEPPCDFKPARLNIIEPLANKGHPKAMEVMKLLNPDWEPPNDGSQGKA